MLNFAEKCQMFCGKRDMFGWKIQIHFFDEKMLFLTKKYTDMQVKYEKVVKK